MRTVTGLHPPYVHITDKGHCSRNVRESLSTTLRTTAISHQNPLHRPREVSAGVVSAAGAAWRCSCDRIARLPDVSSLRGAAWHVPADCCG